MAESTISRRDFLRLGKYAAGAVTLMFLESGCRLRTPEGDIDFQTIGEGQETDLILPNEMNPTRVAIEYSKHGDDFTPLQIRQDTSRNVTFQPFKDGVATTRMMGEITDPHIYRMVANPALKDKSGNPIPIGMYPSAASVYNAEGKTVIPPNQEYSVLRVITRVSDYLDDQHPNAEKNAHPWGEHPVAQFGDGACIGMLNTADGKQVFKVMGFVQDLRALVPAPVK